MSNFHCIEDKE